MENAISAVKEGLSLRKAAEKFGINYGTLRNRLHGLHELKPGEATRKFTDDEENFIGDVMLSCAKVGIPFNKFMLKRIVFRLCEAKGKEMLLV